MLAHMGPESGQVGGGQRGRAGGSVRRDNAGSRSGDSSRTGGGPDGRTTSRGGKSSTARTSSRGGGNPRSAGTPRSAPGGQPGASGGSGRTFDDRYGAPRRTGRDSAGQFQPDRGRGDPRTTRKPPRAQGSGRYDGSSRGGSRADYGDRGRTGGRPFRAEGDRRPARPGSGAGGRQAPTGFGDRDRRGAPGRGTQRDGAPRTTGRSDDGSRPVRSGERFESDRGEPGPRWGRSYNSGSRAGSDQGPPRRTSNFRDGNFRQSNFPRERGESGRPLATGGTGRRAPRSFEPDQRDYRQSSRQGSSSNPGRRPGGSGSRDDRAPVARASRSV